MILVVLTGSLRNYIINNMSKEMHTWFLKGGACSMDEKGKPILFAKQGVLVHNGIISVGYSAKEKVQGEIGKIHNFSEYQDHYKKILTWKNTPMYYLYDKMNKGDIIWTRVSGSIYLEHKDGYYVTIVENKDFYFNDVFNDAKNIDDADCLVGLKNIKWVGPFSEDEIPGSVSRYIQGKTIVPADSGEEKVTDENGNSWTYTSAVSYLLLCEKEKATPIKFNKKSMETDDNKLEFLKLIGWRGLEDITALWLQQKYGYYLQPSTCKSGTPSYEYVLIEPETGRKIFVQTKNNPKTKIDENDYRSCLIDDNDEFYLVTTGFISGNSGNIVILKKDESKDKYIPIAELIDFVFDKDNERILPAHIVKCKKYLFD